MSCKCERKGFLGELIEIEYFRQMQIKVSVWTSIFQRPPKLV